MSNRAEANLSALIESTKNLIWSVDLEYRLTVFNSALRQHFEESFGIRLALGMRPRDMVPPERARLMPPLYARALAEGSFQAEFPLTDGRTLELAFNPIVVDGEKTGVSVIGKDVTEQKATESALKKAERNYRAIFDGALEGMFQVSPNDARLLNANPALAKILGYDSAEEMLSAVNNVLENVWVDPDEQSRFTHQREEHGDVRGFECRSRRKDGSIIWIALSSRRVCGADGRTLHYEGFMEDITERKAVETALREAEKKYHGIFDGALEGMFQLSPEGKPLVVNRALARMLGYDSPEEFLSSVTDVVQQEWVNPEEYASYAEGMAVEGFVRILEGCLKRKDGSIIWGLITARNVCDADGKPLYQEGFIIDITERKAAETALREAEKKYRNIFDGALEGIFQCDSKGAPQTANRAAVKMLGYDSLDDLKTTVTNLRDQLWVDQDMRANFNQQLGEHGVVHGFKCRLRRKDGTIILCSVNAQRVCSADGRCLYLEGSIIDITERMAAEAELHESEARYRSTFEQAAVGIAHTSFKGEYLRCNARFAEIAGYPLEEIPSLTVQQTTHPDDLAESESLRIRLSKAESDQVCIEKRLIRKDGSLTWIRMTSWPQHDSEGHMIYLVSLAEDINDRKAAEERLAAAQDAQRLSEERYRVAFQTSIDAIVISRLEDGKYFDVNRAFLRLLGYERDEVIGRTSVELGIWPNPQERQRLVEALRKEPVCRDLEFQFVRKNGQKLWVLVSGSLMELDGVPSYLLVARDISDAKAAAEALRLSEERYRTIFQTTPDIIAINRLSDGKYIDCNQTFLDAVGYTREEVIGRTSLELGIWANDRDRETMAEMMRESSNCRGFEAQFKKKNGEMTWGEISASQVEIDGVRCLLSVTRDLSYAKAAENTIRSLAYYDALTGLANRRLLLEKLHQPPASGVQSNRLRALLMVDLDNFKKMNDTLGHQKGDLLLQEVARRISTCVHEGDVVSRLGGDEFVVMLEDLNEVAEEAANQAKAIGERILDSLGQPYVISEHEYLTTASIGITLFKNREDSTDDFLQQALIAQHQAKAAGRNVMRFFSPALQATVNARATMEDDLRQAIKKGQFELYYQPQVEAGRLTGVEALIRWMHPRRGIVPPGEFIPMAEETGLILPLGEWILKAACTQIAAWAEQRHDDNFAVAVNISALQFRQPEFVEQVLAALSRAGTNPKTLKLELTESMLAENLDEVITKMTELKSHGLSFSLDDFGTGYSSLSYLKRLPLDQMKIDRAFVRDMMVDATSGAIAQTILSLGRAMGLSVIAEGVETEEQRGFLAGLGCHSFQGFLFSHPLPLSEFQAFWENYAKATGPLKK
jgi:diguanylate cyclase (GGDEF)-like protein/PAS domain S-box-containing protein